MNETSGNRTVHKLWHRQRSIVVMSLPTTPFQDVQSPVPACKIHFSAGGDFPEFWQVN